MNTILIIEDDTAIRRGIVDALEFSGYAVIQSGDGEDGMHKATCFEYDLLLLDLALPAVPGLDILRRVRNCRPDQPMIILTAKGDDDDRVRGLRLGADDYVVKPFSIKELLARIEAVLRRCPQRPSGVPTTCFAEGWIDFDRRELRFRDTTRQELSERESQLLAYLVQNRGRAVSREELLCSLWRMSPRGITTRTIDMHIARLRGKLRDDGECPATLLTVRGKGYMWTECDIAET